MTVTIDGELLVSQWNDSKIMCKSHDTCRTLIELPFGDIVGIHASRHNDIFIGMVVELGIQPLNAISDSTECFILVFGFDGTYKRSCKFNEENKYYNECEWRYLCHRFSNGLYQENSDSDRKWSS